MAKKENISEGRLRGRELMLQRRKEFLERAAKLREERMKRLKAAQVVVETPAVEEEAPVEKKKRGRKKKTEEALDE